MFAQIFSWWEEDDDTDDRGDEALIAMGIKPTFKTLTGIMTYTLSVGFEKQGWLFYTLWS